MSEDKTKQFENEQLNILLNDLKDIDKFTGFKNGAFVYYLGKYQANLLLNYIEQLKSQLEQSKNETKQRDDVIDECIDAIQNFMTHIDDGFCADMMTFIDILNKRGGTDE